MNVLLVEPGYPTRYPPLGLLKIGRFHRKRGDEVRFVRGCSEEAASPGWDRIYVSCVFTYHWNVVVRTLRFYAPHVKDDPESALFVGGVLATLMADELTQIVSCRPIAGTVRSARMLDLDDDTDVDALLPDYDLIQPCVDGYVVATAFLATATRGCANRCPFCTVSRIEPDCREYVPIHSQVLDLERSLGTKRDLLMLDNNILASQRLSRIVMDIAGLGFWAGATWNPGGGRRVPRHVDFTQGFETTLAADPKSWRLLDLLALIAVHPVRIAFDEWDEREEFGAAIGALAERGFRTFETPVLYDFRDTPGELYRRLRAASETAETLGVSLSLHPIRYIAPGQKTKNAHAACRNEKNAWEADALRSLHRMLSGRPLRTPEDVTERLGASEELFLRALHVGKEHRTPRPLTE